MQRGAGVDGSADGLLYQNVLGTYTHLHALGTPEWARGMIRSAAAYRRRRTQGAA
jgi:cobyrinic acid a,c-diamide synthase